MTRKKYIKQLMALGMSRNRANFRATLCRASGVTYADDYKTAKLYLRLNQATRNVAVTIRAAAAKLCSALGVTAAAINRLRDSIAQHAQTLVVHHPTPYTPENLGDGLPYNMQIMSQADHAALHGYACGIDLANGPDFSAGGGGND